MPVSKAKVTLLIFIYDSLIFYYINYKKILYLFGEVSRVLDSTGTY
jgi:hypothetical protein